MAIEAEVLESTVITKAPAQVRAAAPVYVLTIFLSAMLLFQVELIISKYVLPWFGGAAAVWTTAMLVFQVLLFGGYGYAHAISRLRLSTQVKLHLALVTGSVLIIALLSGVWPSPITPASAWKPQTPDHPVTDILVVLLGSVGLPFFVLSTTGPLLQEWYARASVRSPYRLYAVSNLGSLIGLLSYPVAVEPLLKIRTQAWVWSILYMLFSLGVMLCAKSIRTSREETDEGGARLSAEHSPSLGRYLLWIGLAACASVILLAATSKISLEVAATPMIWVLPLSLYLISLIICFGKQSWYKRAAFHWLFVSTVAATALSLASGLVWAKLASLVVLVFCVCIVCHGEIARLKPAPAHLTAFYLCLSGGAAVGGILAGLIAPAAFPKLWEFDAAVLGTMMLLAVVLVTDKQSWFHEGPGWALVASVAAAVVPVLVSVSLVPGLAPVVKSWKYYPAALLMAVPVLLTALVFDRKKDGNLVLGAVQAASLAALLLVGYAFVRSSLWSDSRPLARNRNFYGILEVFENPIERSLFHGTTLHGAQWRDPAYKHVATTYYGKSSGFGQMMIHHPKRSLSSAAPMRVGVVGLGTGTIAAWGMAGDYMRFYELDPAVLPLVQGKNAWFSFLNVSPATIDVVLGDGRLSLERELSAGTPQQFDVLVLDAFSGDAIPIHLLTKEAFEMYMKHLSGPEAVVAVHISSRIVNLRPVVAGIAQEFKLHARWVVLIDGYTNLANSWVLLSADPRAVDTPGLAKYGRSLPSSPEAKLWTDDFSDVVRLLVRPSSIRGSQ